MVLDNAEAEETKKRATEKKRTEIAAQVAKARKEKEKKEKPPATPKAPPAAKAAATATRVATKAKPNDPCPCGSGKKYKKCHMKV